MQACHVQVGAELAHRVQIGLIGRVVNEGAQKNLVLLQQVFEQVVRADLVALVGWVGQPVHQVKQLAHARVQARLRTMNGPNQLASPMGMRRQVSINSLNLALEGLFCGMASRLYRQYW